MIYDLGCVGYAQHVSYIKGYGVPSALKPGTILVLMGIPSLLGRRHLGIDGVNQQMQ